MTKLSLYKYAVALLVVINAGVLAFFLMRKPPPRAGGRANPFEQLHLSPEQHEEAQDLARQHHEALKQLLHEEAATTAAYFSIVIEQPLAPASDSLKAVIGQLQEQKIELTHAHFVELRGLLSEDQQALFPAFLDQSLGRILHAAPMRKTRKRRE